MAYKARQPRVYISQRGGRKKIYQDKYIYLQNGDEFDIEIENPTKKTVLAKIEIDGKSISNAGLVIQPGERFLLERYIDENRKFKFNTYNIDGSDSEMVDAISENGKVKITFYNEKEIQQLCNPCVWVYPYVYPWNGTANPYWYGGCTTTINCDGNNSVTNINNVNSDSTLKGGGTTTTNAFYSASADIGGSQMNFTSNTGMSLGDLGLDGIFQQEALEDSNDNDSLETGRVGKGQSTSQDFEYVDMDFETLSSHTVELQILPESRKPVSKKTQAKVYCHKCGSKAKKGDSFCAKCGTELYK